MNCPRCGSILEGKEHFCEFCGYEVMKRLMEEKIENNNQQDKSGDQDQQDKPNVVISKPLARKLLKNSNKLEQLEMKELENELKGNKEKENTKKNKVKRKKNKKVEESPPDPKPSTELKLKALECISDKIKFEKEFQKKLDALFPKN